MYIYLHVEKLPLTHPLHKANLWNVFEQNLHESSIGFHYFIAILKLGSKSIDLILSGMSSHILGVKDDNNSVALYTNFTGLV